MGAYFRFVLRHRVIVTLVVLGLTALAGWSISRAVVASSLQKLFFGESPAYLAYNERVRAFGTEEVNVFAIEAPDMLAADQQSRLRQLTERLEALPDFSRAITVLDAQHITSHEDNIHIETYADEALADPSRIPELMESLQTDPLAAGLTVSEDGQFTAILLEIIPDPTRPAERVPKIAADVLDIFEEVGIPRSDVHPAGLLVTITAMVEQTTFSLRTIFPVVVIALLLTVWLMFRRLWPAIISSAVSFVAVIWTVGFAVQLDREINIMIAIVPTVILVVGFSDVVHLCSAYLLELGDGANKRQAIVRSAEDVGRACFFTSATTFTGFLCLSLVPTPMFRTMGVILGFGVAVALLIAMTIVPILFSWMKQPKPLREGASSSVHRALDGLLKAMQRFATRRAMTVIVVFGVALILALVGLSRLEIETNFSRRLSEDNPIRQELSWYQEHFEGTTGLDIFIETEQRNGLLDPEVFLRIAQYQDTLTELGQVDTAFSLVDLMRELYEVYNPERAAVEPLPDSREGLSQLLELFGAGGGSDLDRLVDFNRQNMRILLRLNDDGLRACVTVAEQARVEASRILGDRASVIPSGLTFLLGDWLDEIIAGQRKGLLLSLVIITIMMIVALASFRNALWSMLPNVFPLLLLGGVLGGFERFVDSDTLVIALLAIGIGVDDTIHFLVRLRIECKRTDDKTVALERTFAFAGRAIVMTTIILVVGFAPFIMSDYYSTRIIGTLLPLCLIVALLADLLLVPALAKRGFIRFPMGHERDDDRWKEMAENRKS